MSDPTTLYASGEDAITRIIELDHNAVRRFTNQDEYEAYYDIERTAAEIVKGDHKRTALQFPDELLHDSVPIYRLLKARVGPEQELYVLADTSYGSCCVDEVAAQHVDADAMVHYGHACMSETSRLPVIYVFGRTPIDVPDAVVRLVECVRSSEPSAQRILLRTEVQYAYIADRIAEQLREALPSRTIIFSPTPTSTHPRRLEEEKTSTETSAPAEDTYDTIFYIGGESLALTNLLITNASCQVYSYSPKTKSTRLESAQSNKLLMRRYAAVQKARDADVFGILVGTLGVASYLPLITRLRALLARAHKKTYTITVGKLNPAKLGNFLEIECFVLVACPENSLVDAKEFLRPIVTPYELEVALQPEPVWTGQYELNFSKLALDAGADNAVDNIQADDDDADKPTFSLITGQYRHAKRYGADAGLAENENTADASAVSLRNQNTALGVMADSAAAQFLQSRTFRGLETRLGEDVPSVLEQGRSGIARGYQDDHR